MATHTKEIWGTIVTVANKKYKIVSRCGDSVGLETLNGNDRIVIDADKLQKFLNPEYQEYCPF